MDKEFVNLLWSPRPDLIERGIRFPGLMPVDGVQPLLQSADGDAPVGFLNGRLRELALRHVRGGGLDGVDGDKRDSRPRDPRSHCASPESFSAYDCMRIVRNTLARTFSGS